MLLVEKMFCRLHNIPVLIHYKGESLGYLRDIFCKRRAYWYSFEDDLIERSDYLYLRRAVYFMRCQKLSELTEGID